MRSLYYKFRNGHMNGNLNTDHLPYFSGNWSNTSNTGTFNLHCNNYTTNANSNITSHCLTYVLYKILLLGFMPCHLAKY